MPRSNTMPKTDLTNTQWLLAGTFNTLTYSEVDNFLNDAKDIFKL